MLFEPQDAAVIAAVLDTLVGGVRLTVLLLSGPLKDDVGTATRTPGTREQAAGLPFASGYPQWRWDAVSAAESAPKRATQRHTAETLR